MFFLGKSFQLATCTFWTGTYLKVLKLNKTQYKQEIKMNHQLDHILGQSDGLKHVLYRSG
jgi:hypothetical protein